MRKCFLHIGTHKTATTSLQNFLDSNPQVLAESGYLYPQVGRPDGASTGHHNIAWEISGDRRFRPDYGTAEDLTREIAQSDQDIVASSEDFECSAHHSERFGRFIAAIQKLGIRVNLIVYFRNQIDYAESLYGTLVHHGFDQPFSAFCDEILETGAVRWREWIFPFHYESFIGNLATLSDIEITIRSYDHPSLGSLILDFLSVIGIGLGGVSSGTLPHENRRPNLGETIQRYWTNRGASLDDAELREITDLCAKFRVASAAMSSTRQARFVEAFEKSNRRLCERYQLPRFDLTRRLKPSTAIVPSLDAVFGLDRRVDVG